MKKVLPLLLFLILFYPLLSVAQNSSDGIQETIIKNSGLIQQFAQLAPLGINPYATVFITALCAKLGFHNSFVATNPFFNSWTVLLIFGGLFLFTTLVGTVFKSNKVTAPIALADNYLSDQAALVINAVIMLAPLWYVNNSLSENPIVYQASFLALDLKTALVLISSMYFLIVVMSVRFFIDILIFLSPIPFIDNFLGLIKTILTTGLVAVSIASPTLSVLISIVLFIGALFFYKRSVRLTNKIKYLFIYPILNIFRDKEQVLTNGAYPSVLVYLKKKTSKFKEGQIVRLEKQQNKFYLVKKKFLFSTIEEEISLTNCYFVQNQLDIELTNNTENYLLIFNRSHHNHIEKLSKIFEVSIQKKTTSPLISQQNFWNKLKFSLNKKDLKRLGEF